MGGLSSGDPLQPQDSNVCWALSLPGTVLRAGCEFSVLSSFLISGLVDDSEFHGKRKGAEVTETHLWLINSCAAGERRPWEPCSSGSCCPTPPPPKRGPCGKGEEVCLMQQLRTHHQGSTTR